LHTFEIYYEILTDELLCSELQKVGLQTATVTVRGAARTLRRDKRGGLRDGSLPAESRGIAPVRSGAKPPEAGDTYMLNIRLNIAIDRHKSRTVQSPITLRKNFQLRRGTCTHW